MRVNYGRALNYTRFSYRNDLANGQREFVVVDAIKGTRELVFDHIAVAEAMKSKGDTLRLEAIEFDAKGELLAFLGDGKRFAWNAETKTLTELSPAQSDNNQVSQNSNRTNARTGADSSISFVNRLSVPVELFWINSANRQIYGKLEPGDKREQHTFGGHRWEIVNDKGGSLGAVTADDTH